MPMLDCLSSFTNVKQLAKQYHPDTNKDETAKAKFVEIQDAYDVSVACC